MLCFIQTDAGLIEIHISVVFYERIWLGTSKISYCVSSSLIFIREDVFIAKNFVKFIAVTLLKVLMYCITFTL